MFKRLLEIIFWIGFTGGLIFMLSFTGKKQKDVSCKGIDIIIAHAGTEEMISEFSVLQVLKDIDDSIGYKKISELPITEIYDAINKNQAIKQSSIYTGIDGAVKIKIHQRKPVIKIFNTKQTLYIDEENILFKSRSGESARVIVANGNISPVKLNNSGIALLDTLQNRQYSELLALTEAIREDDFLNSIIEQIYVNADKEYELIPKIGRQIILLGKIDNYKNKLSNLKAYFVQGAATEGWTKYKTINLKFKNQVVCEKK